MTATTGRAPAPGARAILARAGLVAAGGVVGTTVRALVETAAPPPPGGFPWTTFAINVLGSFLLGALLETLVLSDLGEQGRRTLRLVVGTGVLGGFTSYSTFVLETLARAGADAVPTAVAYALASVAVGVAAAVLGIVAARRARRGRPS